MAAKKLRPGTWERGTRKERRERLQNAIRRLGEVMKEFDYLVPPEPRMILGGSKRQKKPHWEFCP